MDGFYFHGPAINGRQEIAPLFLRGAQSENTQTPALLRKPGFYFLRRPYESRQEIAPLFLNGAHAENTQTRGLPAMGIHFERSATFHLE